MDPTSRRAREDRAGPHARDGDGDPASSVVSRGRDVSVPRPFAGWPARQHGATTARTRDAASRNEHIDVSHYETKGDVAAAARAGLLALWAKTGQGVGSPDESYARFRDAAREAGILFGSYHVLTNVHTGEEQADDMLSRCDPQGLLAADVETIRQRDADGVERDDSPTLEHVLAFMQHVYDRTQRWPTFYSYTNFIRNLRIPAGASSASVPCGRRSTANRRPDPRTHAGRASTSCSTPTSTTARRTSSRTQGTRPASECSATAARSTARQTTSDASGRPRASQRSRHPARLVRCCRMPWEPDAETIAASDHLQHHPYDGGGPWSRDARVPALLPHAARLRRMILREFPEIHIGTETARCSPMNTRHGAVNNLHSVGRALDCMTPHLSDSVGAALANWAVQHAADLGIQLVIWDDKAWQGSSPAARRWTDYTSRNPADNTLQHRDHVHIERPLIPSRGSRRAHRSRRAVPGSRHGLSTPAVLPCLVVDSRKPSPSSYASQHAIPTRSAKMRPNATHRRHEAGRGWRCRCSPRARPLRRDAARAHRVFRDTSPL